MSNTKTISSKTLKLAQTGILIAIMLVLHFTGIGYIKISLIELTIMMIPVIIGAITTGPAAGALLGGVFGLTSFIQCFGTSAFGTLIFGINPILTAITCFIPRILTGFLVGLIFKALSKIDTTKLLSFAVSSLCGALLNTILFMTCVIVFFWNNTEFASAMTTWGLSTENLWKFLIAFVGVNGLIEAVVCFIVGAALAKAVVRFIPNNK